MSWQAYVDTSLVGTGHIDKASIISAAGDSEWATSANFKLEAAEMKAIADVLSNTGNARDNALAEGLYIAKERYVLTNVDDNSIYARQGRAGVCIAKSKQAILIGHHPETAIAGNAVMTTGSLADYLKNQGY